ncbi:MAG: prepilin-type N-terminal cleavage/methylation domain-containing protein [bacterium]|nr:prepilin-type N-terminal cleavage/methylation domain-containing protein [bacterium]MDD5354388.1 prepilin-type N-terminal cleavage/methylation domain-containing protein [bacterium]MDD5755859.1 prepilin-type N-terminal cleavage/methylation domain-containing protein [bacterium]
MILATGRKNLNKLAGFTLIEISIVVTIIAILLVVAMPTLSKMYAGTQLRTDTQDLAETLRYAYQAAVNRQNKYKIYCDQSSGSYRLEQELPGIGFQEIKTSLIKDRILSNGVYFKKLSRPYFFVYPNGSADNMDVQLANEVGDIYTIKFNGLTGRVEVFDHAED